MQLQEKIPRNRKPHVVFVLGGPGSGKGTQAQILKDSVLPNLHILTVSSLLKEKSADGSVLGDEIKKSQEDYDVILKHEHAHASLGHTYDLMLFELFTR